MISEDRTEKVLGILHTVHTELSLDLHSKKITYDLATLVYHIAQAGAYPKYAKFYKSLYPNFPALQTKYTEVLYRREFQILNRIITHTLVVVLH